MQSKIVAYWNIYCIFCSILQQIYIGFREFPKHFRNHPSPKAQKRSIDRRLITVSNLNKFYHSLLSLSLHLPPDSDSLQIPAKSVHCIRQLKCLPLINSRYFFIHYFFAEGKKLKGCLGMMWFGDGVGRFMDFPYVRPSVSVSVTRSRATTRTWS